jgi:two-component system cell cycle sensor histidine kinase/response regulator CckA
MSSSSSKLQRLGGGALFEALRVAANRSRLGLALVFVNVDPPEILLLNEYGSTLLGYSAEEVLKLGPWPLLAPEEAERLRTMGLAGEPAISTFETLILTKEGRRVPMDVTLSEVEIDGRNAFVAFFRDASERWRAISALQESEERFRTLVEGAPDGVAILNGARIRFLNPRAARMLGLPNSEAGAGRLITEFLHSDDETTAQDRIRQLLETGRRHREPAEYRSQSIDGKELNVEISAIPIDIGGERAVLAFARDVTERKAIQSRLAEAERLTALGVLSAGVAHEINNPLAYVLLNLEYLRRELPKLSSSPEKLDDLMVRVRDACHGAERVATIVRDLRTFARGDDSVRGPVDLREVMDAAVSIAGTTLSHRARLVRDYADAPLVDGNSNRLEQVFLNLLLNAVQAMPERSASIQEITVRLRGTADTAVAEVEDNGEGIPEALLARIFEPFFTTKPVGVGTGLGLPICRSIVAAHGGTIEVDSKPGVSTVFRVVLPASLAKETKARESSRAPAIEAPRGIILVVDDEAAVGATLRLVLQGEHDVELAVSGEEALERLRERHFDAILCDLMMPGMTGMELYEVVRATYPGLEGRMIFMTGGNILPNTESFLAKLMNPLLEKPFDIPLVRRLLRGFVGSPH